MTSKKRILAIDIMRGLTLFLMLFVNDLFEPGVPEWMVHSKATEDRMGLADWVFPGFLFMVGMAIPFAFISRERKGESRLQLLKHILIRTLSLLIIGVFMVNISDLNEELTGMSKYLWAILAYVSVFLIWNLYPDKKQYQLFFKGLKMLGIIGLISLAFIFRSGTSHDPQWMSTSWWGILGLIGWGYFAAAMTYFITGSNLIRVIMVWLVFVVLNMLSYFGLTDFLSPVHPILGVLLDGNTPSIVLGGLLVGLLLKKYKDDHQKLLRILIPLGIIVLVSGFVLRNWFIISKIMGTPSWAMICNGISILVFCLIFYLMDIKGYTKWAEVFRPAGQNSLTTYLAPDIIYFSIWGLGLNLLLYKQEQSMLLAVAGSLLWAFLMIWFAALLSRIGIRLKL